ncbi:MAG TPA: tetratricopeptide repeat protein [Bryobacteraceae bacterium]
MKTLFTMMLLLAPQTVHAALVLEPDYSCCATEEPQAIDADALNNRGGELYAAGDYSNARKMIEESIRIQQSKARPNLDSLSNTLFNLAAVARAESRMAEAEGLYQRAITTRESISGPEAKDLAHPLAGLALVYMAEGRLTEAVDLARRAVRVSESAVAQNTLGTLLLMKGEDCKVEALEQAVVDDLERNGKTEGQDYIDALANLGAAQLRQAKYRQADLSLHRAEQAAVSAFGPNHATTATIWNNRAKVLMAQGDVKGAETLYRQAIAVWRKTLGPAHPDVAQGLSNLAALYESGKRYSEAERLYNQALGIDQAWLGAQSLKVANDWNNLGALSARRHRYQEAEDRLSKALAIAGKQAGGDHPDTNRIAVNLAVVYYYEGKYANASVEFAKSVSAKQRTLPSDSPELLTLLKMYANSIDATRVTAR